MGAIQPRHLPRPCILPGWWHTTIVSQFGGSVSTWRMRVCTATVLHDQQVALVFLLAL